MNNLWYAQYIMIQFEQVTNPNYDLLGLGLLHDGGIATFGLVRNIYLIDFGYCLLGWKCSLNYVVLHDSIIMSLFIIIVAASISIQNKILSRIGFKNNELERYCLIHDKSIDSSVTFVCVVWC